MASEKTIIAESAQEYFEKSDWHAVIREMEKLFVIDRDPHIRVRIGDVLRKLNEKEAAMREYVRAADLFAAQGFVAKALAQYKLALSLDAANNDVWSKMVMLRRTRTFAKLQRGPREYSVPQPFAGVIPHSAFNGSPSKLLANSTKSGL